MFALPLTLPNLPISWSNNTNEQYPPLPWSVCTGFSYECGHCCEVQKYGIDGNIKLWDDWSLPWVDTILIGFVNLLLLINPTPTSNRKIPSFLLQQLSLKHADPYVTEFSQNEISTWIDLHWIYFSRQKRSSVSWRNRFKESLATLVEKGFLTVRNNRDKSFYRMTEDGAQHLITKFL